MPLYSDLDQLRAALNKDREFIVYYPFQVVPHLLNALAGLLEATPATTPLGRILEPVLKALPAGALAVSAIRRLADEAGDCQAFYTLAASGEVAKALRKLAKELTDHQDHQELLRSPPRPEIRLERQAERLLSRRRQGLVLFLLQQAGQAAHERDVIVNLWPAERRRKAPSPASRNRLHKLVHDTNEALLELDGSTWQIRRHSECVLHLEQLGRGE
jgi:hypothetical protein